jgi:glycosyltransferase involved in cell wall biosynthesis
LVQLLKPFGKETLKKADKIIAVSEYEKSLICSQFNFSQDKIEVIPNGVSFDEFSGLRKTNKDYRSILYVGYLIDFKGAAYLVDVLPRLADNVILEIVGRGPLKPKLEKLARDLKVEDRVRFYHGLPRHELLQKYADADVFALLSRYEAYSIVVAEALAAGTPCVVTRTSALSEWIDNNTCFGVDYPVSLNDLADQIDRALESKVDRKSTAKWNGTKILDWNDVVERLEKVYFA